MKIVNVNKFYYLRGGAERYFFSLGDLLTAHGHEVIPFAMQHPENLSTPYAKYFPSYVEFGKKANLYPKTYTLKPFFRMFWSREVAKKFDRLLTDTKPDLIHLHNIYHQLSPSLFPIAKRHDIPVVMTVHDYSLVWPDYLLCGYKPGGSYWNVVRERCVQGSYMKSLLVVLEKKFHDWLRVYAKHVDLFLVPSTFVKEKLIAGGYDEKRIRVLPHFIEVTKSQNHKITKSQKHTLLFFGRLSKEKGVDILLQMMHDMESDVELRIAGEGQEKESLQSKVKSRKLLVTFLGRLDTVALQEEIDRATLVVVPSVVPETFGYTILESFARGKPVVASRVGAFPELVEDGVTGLLVEPGDPVALRKRVCEILADAKKRTLMGTHALATAQKYAPEEHYEQLLDFYQELL